MAIDPRLVDTSTKSVHQLAAGTKYLLASHSHLFPPSLGTQASSISPPLHLLLPPPLTHNEQYCVQLEVDGEGHGLVTVWVGECCVDKKNVPVRGTPVPLSHESHLQMGQDLVLQYMTNSEGLPRRRLLPQTPGQQLSEAPPSKPTRTQPLQPLQEKTEAMGNGNSSSLSLEESLNPGLRERLKRIAREVNSRDSGAGRSKPPPPYEQVGNSIGYQLLLQQQGSEGDVTSLMIDSLYPMLKYMQLKEQSLEQFYTDYLEQYSTARRAGATPTNMHPEDTPTIVFIVDTLIQLCSLPRVNELAVRYCPVWMRLLSIFCLSPRNQLAMATKRLATKVVSCMGLGIMSEQPDFQTHGWSVLTHVVATPTPRGSKPALPEPAIALALPLVEKQLDLFGGQLPLATAVLGFLAQLASTAKMSQSRRTAAAGAAGGVAQEEEEEEEEVYTAEQASRVLELLSAHSVLRHVMKVPPNVRKDSSFDAHYCLLVKALVPTRKKVATKPPSLAPSAHSTSALAPPAKPKRIRRATTDANLMGSRKSRKSRKSYKSRVEETNGTSSAPGADMSRSLSEENIAEFEGKREEEEEEEETVVRSEGEEEESDGEQQAEKRLKEMKALKENMKTEGNTQLENGTADASHKSKDEYKEKQTLSSQGDCERQANNAKAEPSDVVAPSPPTSPPPTSPLSPDSLAGDIATALAEVRQPIRQYSLKRNPGQPEVHVPDVPMHNSYYRTSLKRKSLKSTTVDEEPISGRQSWAPVTPPSLPVDHTHPLETSVDLWTAEVECGHGDMCVALSDRLQMLQGVWGLWREGRGLQAATNCVRGCFSEDVYDTALFCDLLRCFSSFQAPWTLAVVVVLLPVIVQLLSSLREPTQLVVLVEVVDMVVQRFSSSILACKKGNKSRRVSATSDLQQRATCYTTLHKAWISLGDRLECKDRNAVASDSSEIISLLSTLRQSLTPFSTQLLTS